jgi:excisionase family DNA binding protein
MKYDDLPERTFVTPDEVCQFLSISRSTLGRYLDEGLLRGTKIGSTPSSATLRIYRYTVISMVERGRTDRIEDKKPRRMLSRGLEED